MTLITRENVDQYYEFLTHQHWDRIDFRQYSKVLNPGLATYDFSFSTLLEKTNTL